MVGVIDEYGQTIVEDYFPVPNESDTPEDHYKVTCRIKGHRVNGRRVVGYIHTHPPGYPEPSEEDMQIHPLLLGGIYFDSAVRVWFSSSYGWIRADK